MVLIRAVMLLTGVLAVLLLGVGTTVAAAPDHAPPPCHAQTDAAPTTGHDPGKPTHDMKAMACCVACVAAALPAVPPAPGVAPAPAPLGAPLPTTLTGLTPAPEPHPPRTVAI